MVRRTPLRPIDSNRTYGSELSPNLRGKIVGHVMIWNCGRRFLPVVCIVCCGDRIPQRTLSRLIFSFFLFYSLYFVFSFNCTLSLKNWLVTGQAQVGCSIASIARLYSLAHSTITYTLEQDTLRTEGNPLSRLGRPSILSDSNKRLILRIITRDPFILYSEIR